MDAQGFPVASERILPLLSSQSARLETVDAKEWYLYSEDRTLLAGPAATQAELLADLGLDEAPGSVCRTVRCEALTLQVASRYLLAARRSLPGGTPISFLNDFRNAASET